MHESSGAELTHELIQGLLLEVGRLIEDESPSLALILPRERALVIARVDRLHQIAADILAIATAAQVLARGIGEDAG